MAWILENNIGCAMGHEDLTFESLHEVIEEDALDKAREALNKAIRNFT